MCFHCEQRNSIRAALREERAAQLSCRPGGRFPLISLTCLPLMLPRPLLNKFLGSNTRCPDFSITSFLSLASCHRRWRGCHLWRDRGSWAASLHSGHHLPRSLRHPMWTLSGRGVGRLKTRGWLTGFSIGEGPWAPAVFQED